MNLITNFAVNCLRIIPDSLYLRLVYRFKTGKHLNLKNPKTFNEKLQWLKLHDRNPLYTTLVDKCEVKKYVAEKIGEEYIIPTLGVWERFDDIDFDSLPNQFVLKCTHDSGSVVICRDKADFDIAAARKKVNRALKRDYYLSSREWPYKNVKHRIIAEEYLQDTEHLVPEDYKIYCINGEPKYIVVFHNRFNAGAELSESVYTPEWEKQDISLDEHFAISDIDVPRPESLDAMLHFARLLSLGMAQSRIDFYVVRNKIYFGEVTLFTASGLQKMIPEELDAILGEQTDLTKIDGGTDI